MPAPDEPADHPVHPASATAGASDGPASRRDLDEGLRFVHTLATRVKDAGIDALARVEALTELLVASGGIDPAKLEERRLAAHKRRLNLASARHDTAVQVASARDKYALPMLPDIDCGARMPLCHARCCTLEFPLSTQDLDEGVVRWNYARPYVIRQAESGFCVHNDASKGGCTVYEHRPATCRTYDCRDDPRLWIDFEGRVPAPWPPEEGFLLPIGAPGP